MHAEHSGRLYVVSLVTALPEICKTPPHVTFHLSSLLQEPPVTVTIEVMFPVGASGSLGEFGHSVLNALWPVLPYMVTPLRPNPLKVFPDHPSPAVSLIRSMQSLQIGRLTTLLKGALPCYSLTYSTSPAFPPQVIFHLTSLFQEPPVTVTAEEIILGALGFVALAIVVSPVSFTGVGAQSV